MFWRWILVPTLALTAAAQSPAPRPQFRISGTVVDSVHGGAVPDVEVSIRLPLGESPLQTVTTEADGRFTFGNLSPGKYGLFASGRGYLAQGYQGHMEFSTGIVTGPGMESEDLTFRLKPDASISGTVLDEFNEPVANAQMFLFRTGVPGTPDTVFEHSQANTDDIGHYRFPHLAEGKYYVVVAARPWYARGNTVSSGTRGRIQFGSRGNVAADSAVGVAVNSSPSDDSAPSGSEEGEPPPAETNVAYPTTYYPNVADPESATPLAVKPGDRASADFHLFAVPGLRLRVHTFSPDARNSISYNVVERIFSMSRGVASQSDEESVTEFAGLAPGRYVLQQEGGGGLPQERPIDLTGDMEVGPGKGSESTSTVSGVVQLESAQPPGASGYLRLMNLASGEGFGSEFSPKGAFTIDGGVRPARYNLAIFNMPGYVVKSISGTGARVTGQQVEITRGTAVRLTVVLAKGLGHIDGVAMRDGKPLSQTAIFLVPSDPAHNLPLFRRDQSDSDGTFTLRDVLPGEYTLISLADGWDLDWMNAAALSPYLGGGVKVRVEADRKYRLKVDVQKSRAKAP